MASHASRREALLTLSGAATVALSSPPPGAAQSSSPRAFSDWSRVRDRFVIEPGLSYMNTGTFGPPLVEALEIETKDRLAMSRNYPVHFVDHYMTKTLPDLVGQMAAFVGASPDEIAFTTGSTESMSYIANGLDLREGFEGARAHPWWLRGRGGLRWFHGWHRCTTRGLDGSKPAVYATPGSPGERRTRTGTKPRDSRGGG